jgi:hypothetical protein
MVAPRIRQRARFRAAETHAGPVGASAGPATKRSRAMADGSHRALPPGHAKRRSASAACFRGVVEDVGEVVFPATAAVGDGRDRRERQM